MEELLVRMRYGFVNHESKLMSGEELADLIGDRFDVNFDHVLEAMSAQKIHFYHLSKVAGEAELREIYEAADVHVQDLATVNAAIKNHEGPLRPGHIPALFLNMDTEDMFERALLHVVGKKRQAYTASSFRDRSLDKPTICRIIESALFCSFGQSVLKVAQDPDGRLHNDLPEGRTYAQALQSRNVRGNRYSALKGCEE